jgi:substrate import-associated zinc metallohydrolase lipoprotein
VSCQDDELSNESIFQDPDTTGLTSFDSWLLSNYTYPYNISVKYKMQDIETSYSYQLSPASPEKSLALSKIIKHIWLETFDEVKGIAFLRQYAPKVIHLIGSNAYNSSGTITLGSAEDGMKITLYDVNGLDVDNPSTETLRRYMKTIIHEFSHILHQNKNYSVDFKAISENNYVGDNWSSTTETQALAYSKGFVSRYARSEPNEDFVEIISIFVVYGQQNWDSILAQAGTDGANIITQKFQIVNDYLKVSWGIDIYELRRVFESRLNSIDKLNLKNI